VSRRRKPLAAAAALALAGFAAAGCGPAAVRADLTTAAAPVTITFWHGWSQPHEVKGIEDNVARFHRAHPEITVKMRDSISDADMTKAIGGGAADPDVVTSFNTDFVGQFCSSGNWIDLTPLWRQSKITAKRTFPRALMDYTQYDGRRCAMPLLADSFGLYYNKDLFAAAGITAPPKTLSELRTAALKLTSRNADGSLAVAGFLPLVDTYEQTANRLVATWQPRYFDGQGHSNLARDPAIRQFLDWQRDLVNALGGYGRLNAFHETLGDEFSPENAFQKGKLAMMFDGEWRTANLAADKVPFGYGTAPFPVPDDKRDTYGAGYLAGTVIGISKNSRHQAAAWELVRYLTTDNDAVTSFATSIRNVPSTFKALDAAPALSGDEHFKTFLTVFASPDSGATPTSADGGESRAGFGEVVKRWQAGEVGNLTAELTAVDVAIDGARHP
jgi:multiple sugar transport system substrate-binding protein